MSGVVELNKYQLVQKLESKKGLQCVVLEKSFVIITFGIGITKLESSMQTLNENTQLNVEQPRIRFDHYWVPGLLYTHYPKLKQS
jgi:hypothetical protein